MPKITGTIKHEDKPFTGMIILNDLSGKLIQYAVADGKPKSDIVLQSNFYTAQFIPSDARNQSSYPQYRWRVPEGDGIEFDKIESDKLV